MSMSTTNKYLRANNAYNELFEALEDMENPFNNDLNVALIIISQYLDYWKENNDVHTKYINETEVEDYNDWAKGFKLVED